MTLCVCVDLFNRIFHNNPLSGLLSIFRGVGVQCLTYLAKFSTNEVLVAMSMTQWLFRIVPCLARGNASATCLKILGMHPAKVQ